MGPYGYFVKWHATGGAVGTREWPFGTPEWFRVCRVSKAWGIPPWVQANLPHTAASPHWRVWQEVYLWAEDARAAHR